jgi:hypothetical protein
MTGIAQLLPLVTYFLFACSKLASGVQQTCRCAWVSLFFFFCGLYRFVFSYLSCLTIREPHVFFLCSSLPLFFAVVIVWVVV